MTLHLKNRVKIHVFKNVGNYGLDKSQRKLVFMVYNHFVKKAKGSGCFENRDVVNEN